MEQPRRRRPGRRARARGGRARHRGRRRDRELRRRAGAGPGHHAAPRRRRGRARVRRRARAAGARASASSTPSRASARHGRGRDRSRRLRARRPPGLPRRGLARPARPAWSTAIRARCAPRTRSFFLEAALRAGGSELLGHHRAAGRPRRTATSRRYGAVFLANVARPTPTAAAALTRYVENGGGLFISVGDRVDADAWNQTMKARAAAAARSQAQRLGAARHAARGRDRRPAPRRAAGADRSPAPAAGRLPRAGRGAGARRASSSSCCWRRCPTRPAARIVLRYENGAPALVDAEVGRGRVLLLTTSVDREWTDLPIRPGFLPLVQEAARYLGGARRRATRPRRSRSAASARSSLGADDRRIEVVKPSGESRWLSPAAPRGRAARAARGACSRRPTSRASTACAPPAPTAPSTSARTRRSPSRSTRSESDPTRLADDKRPDRASGARRGRAGAAAAAGAVARAGRRGDRAGPVRVAVDAQVSHAGG